jgi:hypothetical protein
LPSPPWQLTLRQFLETVQRNYGVVQEDRDYSVPERQGPMIFEYLERPDLAESLALVLRVDEDEVLAPSVLRSLCRMLNLPPGDFHLDPED